MTETIQQLKEDIALLQEKLQKLEEMEHHITPCEIAYKRVYGFYPETYEDNWSSFQDGFFEGCKVEEPDESVEDYLKPHTPEKTEKLLREAFQKVQQTEEWKETQRKIDSNYDELVESDVSENKQKPKTLYDILYRWWMDIFCNPIYRDWDMETSIEDLVDRIEFWNMRIEK
jgi:hypothetical protein